MDRAELDGLAIFLAVAEQNGFRAAARQLGLTPSAISQGIQSLERRVGAALFARTTRSVSLTEAGQKLLAHAKPAASMFQAGLNAARDLGEQPGGNLRINAPRPAVSLLINSLLPEFHEAYPNISLELAGDDEFTNIVEQGFDAGIRLGHTIELDMISTWLTPPDKIVTVGAPGLLGKYPRPGHPRELQGLPALLTRRGGQVSRTWEFVDGGESLKVAVDGPLILNDYEASIRAALRGVGFLHTVSSVIRHHIEQGSLVPVLEDYARDVPGLCLYYPSRSQSLPKLRAFVEFATKRMRQGVTADAFSAQPQLVRQR